MEKTPVSITLPVAGWNAVLTVLGSRPYAEVAELIEAIKVQAAQQLAQQPPAPETAAAED